MSRRVTHGDIKHIVIKYSSTVTYFHAAIHAVLIQVTHGVTCSPDIIIGTRH